jgi:hypothetical protein
MDVKEFQATLQIHYMNVRQSLLRHLLMAFNGSETEYKHDLTKCKI